MTEAPPAVIAMELLWNLFRDSSSAVQVSVRVLRGDFFCVGGWSLEGRRIEIFLKKKNFFCLFRRRLLAEGYVKQEERERHKCPGYLRALLMSWTRVTDNVDSDKAISPGRWPF